MNFKILIVLLACVYITSGTNVKRYNLKSLVKTLNMVVHDQYTLPTHDIRIMAGLERYLEHICRTYRHNGTQINNKYIQIKDNTYSFTVYSDRCNIEIMESSLAINFKDLVSIFNHIIHNKQIYKDNKILHSLKPLIRQYLQDVCLNTFKISPAFRKCGIKKTIFNFGGCLYKLKCNEHDTNGVIHKQKITGMFPIKDIAKLDYCRGEIGLDCNKKCFDEKMCQFSEHKVYSMCDARYYYTCVLFKDKYLSELHRCKYPLLFNGTKCVFKPNYIITPI